jgi:hypothetical protein
MDTSAKLADEPDRGHPALTNWLPGCPGASVAVLHVYPWADFTRAERLAAAVRAEGLDAHTVIAPDGFDSCAVICLATEYRRAKRALLAADRTPIKTDRRGPDAAGDAEPRPSSPRQKPPGYKNRGAALHAYLGGCSIPSAEHRHVAGLALGRVVGSFSDLSADEASTIRAFADSRRAEVACA